MVPHYIIEQSANPFVRHALLFRSDVAGWQVFHIVSRLDWDVHGLAYNTSASVTITGARIGVEGPDEWKDLQKILTKATSTFEDTSFEKLSEAFKGLSAN
jgi:hypothetical protein